MTKKQYSTEKVTVGTVKKSIAAMASRWLRRKVSQRLDGSGSLKARFIQREMVLSETSKPSMRSSPWIRGAPQLSLEGLRPAKPYENRLELIRMATARGGEVETPVERLRPSSCLIRSVRV